MCSVGSTRRLAVKIPSRSRFVPALAALSLVIAGAFAAGASANPACPGATDCPWNSVSTFPTAVSGLQDATDVAVDPADGDIYVVERERHRIVRYPAGNTATPQ